MKTLDAMQYRLGGPVGIREIAAEVDHLASNYRIGQLQQIRAELRGRPGPRGRRIFWPQSTFDEWAFHFGGRSELQFNIGEELLNGRRTIRHGVAFSLESSRSLPDVAVLQPKIDRFNAFLAAHPHEYSDMRLWYWRGQWRSKDMRPSPLTGEMREPGTFAFLGAQQLMESVDADQILKDFDRLLPLYEFVEDPGGAPDIFPVLPAGSRGEPTKFATKGSRPGGEYAIELLHNKIQKYLLRRLQKEFGIGNVTPEFVTEVGTRVDLMVTHAGERRYYEIKTASSARQCTREALSQLLEYAYWPECSPAEMLIIVGQPKADDSTRAYLAGLSNRLRIPVEYMQVRV